MIVIIFVFQIIDTYEIMTFNSIHFVACCPNNRNNPIFVLAPAKSAELQNETQRRYEKRIRRRSSRLKFHTELPYFRVYTAVKTR